MRYRTVKAKMKIEHQISYQHKMNNHTSKENVSVY